MISVVLSVNTDTSINTPMVRFKKKKKIQIFHELSSCLTQIRPEHRKESQTPGLTKRPGRIWHCWLA